MTPFQPRLATALASSLLLAAHALPAAAQVTASPPPLTQLAPNVWLLMGRDGNVVLLPDARGVLLVDDERARDVPEMVAAARTLSAEPIRYVINTHWHLDHSGGNRAFGEAGAVIVAHRNVRERLSTDQFMAAYNQSIPASPAIALPTVVYDDSLTIHFGGETVRLRHTPAAHTDGDTLVFIEDANVLHMGDVFFNGLYPFIDRSSGGSIQGLIASVDLALALSDADTRIVPAHGALASRADLQAYRDMLQTVRDQVQQHRDRGDSLESILALDLHAPFGLEGDGPQFVSAIYDSLASATDP